MKYNRFLTRPSIAQTRISELTGNEFKGVCGGFTFPLVTVPRVQHISCIIHIMSYRIVIFSHIMPSSPLMVSVKLRKKTQPRFLCDHSPKNPFRIRNQYLPSSQLDKQLLNKLKRRMCLNRNRCLSISSHRPSTPENILCRRIW
jgi:hypothetical protein